MLIENRSDSYPFDQIFGAGVEGNDFQKTLYDFFPGIIYVYDVETKQLRYINKKITEFLGYSYDDVLSWENNLNNIVSRDDLALVKQEIEKCNELHDNDTHKYQCRFKHKEGDYLHFCITGKVIKRDYNGKPAALLFIAQDISANIQSAEETKAVRGLIDETENLLQFGTWIVELPSNTIQWSDGMYAVYGYDRSEIKRPLTPEEVLNHVVEEDRAPLTEAAARSIENRQEFNFEFSIIDHRGDLKHVHSRGKVLVNERGEPAKMLGITRCITEQTRTYNALVNYKELIVETEEFLGHGSWEMQYDDRTMKWSDGMYRLFGYDTIHDRDIVLDEKFYETHMSQHDIDESRKVIQTIVDTDNSLSWEYEIKTKSGEIKKLETFAKVVRDKGGKPLQIIGTTRDVTKLRNYERELERKITELKRSNKDLEDFAYVASHDIQEPLRKIISFSERLKNKYVNSLDDEAQRYLERIMTATKSARQLIDGLMDFSRLTREEQSFEKADMNTLFQEVKTELELKIEETEASVKSASLPTLEIVPVQIKQLLSNLLLNSLKFRKQNIAPVIRLGCRRLLKQEVAKHRLDAAVNYFEITVEDNGIGFEEEYAERIFQMFQRLHGKAEYPGAGIGLALCKKIVENHHGIIFAKSRLDHGTVFSIILPEKQG